MTAATTGNLIIDAFSADSLRDVGAETAHHNINDVLFEPGDTPEFVFFPHAGAVVSIVRSTDDGSMVEAGVIGSEGLTSLHTVITEPAPVRNHAIVQIEGDFTRIRADDARSRFQNDGAFRERVLTFTSSFLEQVTQNTLCNRLHSIEARLAKWLLVVRDRCGRDEMQLTQEFLSHMLGIHRPGVSIAVNALEVDALVTHTRNRITIRDRDGLLARACECYAVVHDTLVKLREKLALAS